MTVYLMKYEDAVNAAALLLDEVKPGWAEEIDTDSFAIASMDYCILGQLYGYNGFEDFTRGKIPELSVAEENLRIAFGCGLVYETREVKWHLNEYWVHEIQSRVF